CKGKEIAAMTQRHSKKLEWQIRRIYRARNTLIHHGSKPPQLKTLIENLSSYIHGIIEGLDLLMSSLDIRTIEHGVIEMDIAYKRNLEYLASINEIKDDNFKLAFLITQK